MAPGAGGGGRGCGATMGETSVPLTKPYSCCPSPATGEAGATGLTHAGAAPTTDDACANAPSCAACAARATAAEACAAAAP